VSESSFSQGAVRLIVAHRGASAREAENTIPAFEAAIAAGADAVELDVRITADGTAVVMHDPDVARTTNGGGFVRDLHLSEVKRLRIPTADGSATEVPTLEEALACLSGRCGVAIEIKNIPGEPDFDPGQEPAVEESLRALDAVGFASSVLISSFNPLSIARSRDLAPDVPTGLLATGDVDARAALSHARSAGHRWVLPFAGAVLAAGEGFATEAHEAGVFVGTWVVDDPATAVRFMRDGINGVATNDPAAIVAARAEAFG
jgi:glycerophosphoryl diester phosphodiesterase